MCGTTTGWLWAFFVSSLISVVCGSALAALCMRLWRRQQQRLLLTQQLLLLGVADATLGCWTTWLNAGVLFFDLHSLSWCAAYVFIDKWLMMISVLLSLTLAVGLLARLRRKPLPSVLWHTWWLTPLGSFLLNIGYIVWPGHLDRTFSELCVSHRNASTVNAVEMLLLFICIVILHITVVAQAFGSAPHSVIRRAVFNASKYFLSFLLTYALYVVYYFWRAVDPSMDTNEQASCMGYNIRNWSQVLSQLNGLFNAMAFCIFLCKMRDNQREGLIVAFRAPRSDGADSSDRSADKSASSRRASRRHHAAENMAFLGVAILPDTFDSPRPRRERSSASRLASHRGDLDTPLDVQHGSSWCTAEEAKCDDTMTSTMTPAAHAGAFSSSHSEATHAQQATADGMHLGTSPPAAH